MIRNIILSRTVISILLTTPTLHAIQENTIININEKELREQILQKIEYFKKHIKKIKPYDDNDTDPDGPFKGGLDDPTDWEDLKFGLIQLVFFLIKISIQPPGKLIEKLVDHMLRLQLLFLVLDILTLLTYIYPPILILMAFGDAFDIIDPDKDGR